MRPIPCERSALKAFGPLHCLNDFQAEDRSKLKVTLVFTRNCHHGARAIGGQDIVGQIDRDCVPRKRVRCVGAGETATLG